MIKCDILGLFNSIKRKEAVIGGDVSAMETKKLKIDDEIQ
jgi:hypothetical protein